MGLKGRELSNQWSETTAKELSARHNYLFNRLAPTWNTFPKKIVQAPTLNMFKKGLDDRFKDNGRYS